MISTIDLQRKLRIAGAVFGLVLGISLSWISYIYPFFALREIPIDATSFNLHTSAVIIAVAVSVIGATLGGYLVARFWERIGLALLIGGIVTAIVQTVSAYFVTTASLVNNEFAELIWLGLPLGLLFGVLLAFFGGALGSIFERLVLLSAARLFERHPRAAVLAWALVLGGGLLLGYIASGGSTKRDQTIAGAQALHSAILIAEGQTVPGEAMPPNFHVSEFALGTMRQYNSHLGQPYVISLGQYDGFEVVTDAHFQDGFTLRCVSTDAYISRCFEQ